MFRISVIKEKRVGTDQEDLFLMKATKDGCFSVKLFYFTLGQVQLTLFLPFCLEPLSPPPKLVFSCLRSVKERKIL